MKKYIFLPSLLLSVNLFSQPIINSFSPFFGPVGTIVTIRGTGFGSTTAANLVYFGAVKSDISVASDTLLKVIAPAEATFSPITVTTNNLTAYSVNSFILTYGGAGSFSTSSFLPKTDLTTGIYPHSVILGDFNGDGKSDLLVSQGSSSTIAVFANTSTAGNISFGTQNDLPALGFSHEGAATGDLDGDGKLDIVIANSFNSPSISVYKNISTGLNILFAPKIDYSADNGPYNVAIGDIDGDGKPDLMVANNGSGIISFYKNTSTLGNISFAARIDFNAGTNPYSVAIRDLDGDGKADVAVTTQGSGSSLSVMRNTTTSGIVSFDAPVYAATLSGSFIVSIGDLDGDGKPDMAAASSSSNSIIVVKNVSTPGTLSFYSPQSFTTGTYPVCVSLSDLDGDGKPDMISSNNQSNNISALRNTSTIGNISFESHVDYAAGANPMFVAAGDLDGDGKPDIINANSSDNAVSIYRNIIGENITPVISSFTPTIGINGTVITIVGSNFTGATSVTFGGVEATSFSVDSANGITAITAEGASGNVSVTTPSGTASLAGFIFDGPIINSFTPTIGLTGTIITITGSNFIGVTSVKFGGTSASSFTVNSSTNITAVVGAGAVGSVTVTTSNGTAALPGFSFGVPKITSFTPSSAYVGSAVTITGNNFNPVPANNIVFFGAVKAIVSSATSTQLNVTVPIGATYAPVTVTTGNLTAFSSQSFIPTFQSDSSVLSVNSFSVVKNYGTGLYPSAATIGDLDNDGKPDLIITNAVSNSISVLQNTSTLGTVSFNIKTDYSTEPDPKKTAIGDLDGDGKPDLVVISFNGGNASTMSVFENTSTTGTISFAPKTDYSTGNGSLSIAIADMDGDGKPDVIVTSGNSGFFSFFKNITTSVGIISFAPKQDLILLTHADNIAIADLDNDGLPDLMTSNFSEGNISIFRNKSTGGVFSLENRIDYAAGTNPSYITTGDIDGDGKPDIILTNYASGNISLFKNLSNIGSVSFAPGEILSLAVSNVSVADLSGDGKLDLFSGRGLTGVASILQNTYNGLGNFSFGLNVDFTTGNYDTYTAVGDLDGDGKPDLVVANTLLNTVSILKNTIGSPLITSVSTSQGYNQTTITINGTNFTDVTSVTFGGTPAASFSVISSTKIIAVIGSGASGDITVTNSTGAAAFVGFKFIPQITANGPLTFCKNESVIFTSSAAENNQWYKDGEMITGEVSNTLQVNTSGTYSLKVTNNGITTGNDTDVIVNVTAIPTPVITRDANNNLISTAVTGNQWFLNENLITDATGQIYIPAQSGSYSVQTDLNGCSSDFSSSYVFALTGLINLGNGQFINLYPNPLRDQLNINWNIPNVTTLRIQISDASGNHVFLNSNMQNGNFINLSELPKGIYFINFYSSQLNINKTTRIIKE